MENKKIDLDLDEEMELLKKELEENEKIFNQVKSHYDKVMNSKNPSTLKFITDQTSNVMNIRNNRITIIKEMINIKKLKTDVSLKEMSINKENKSEEDNTNELAKKLYDLMKTDTREGSINNILTIKNNEEIEDNNLEKQKNKDDMLKQRMIEIKSKKEEEKKKKEFQKQGYIIACDLEGNLYAINENGDLIMDDVILPSLDITFSVDELTGLTIATDQYGEEVHIIEVI